MSEVEQFYKAIALKFNYTRAWHELHPMEQSMFASGINQILGVFK